MDCRLCPFCLQARILEWVAIPFSGRSSRTRDRTQVSHIAGKFLTIWAAREAKHTPNPTPQIPERSKSHFLLREDRATSESQHWPKPSRMRVAGGQPTGADGSWGGEASWLPPARPTPLWWTSNSWVRPFITSTKSLENIHKKDPSLVFARPLPHLSPSPDIDEEEIKKPRDRTLLKKKKKKTKKKKPLCEINK